MTSEKFKVLLNGLRHEGSMSRSIALATEHFSGVSYPCDYRHFTDYEK
jgi:hypothetical protein